MNTAKEILFKLHFFHKISPKENKYLYLLISLVLLVLVSPFSSYSTLARLVFSILISILISVSLYAEYERHRVDYVEFGLGCITIISTWLDFFLSFVPIINLITLISYACFFIYFIIELISRIVISSVVSYNLIYASIVGFMSIAILGSILAAIIHTMVPNAYNFVVDYNAHMFEDYVYYSFVTVTTVGYGDVVPTHSASKMLAIFLSVSAHLYSTIILGMIIGKFISSQKS